MGWKTKPSNSMLSYQSFFRLSAFLSIIFIYSCVPKKKADHKVKPKLVVGIVVDQMRPDYISRFSEHFTDGGFKRLIKEGFYNRNTHYNYIPTYTGPGHASIYTGTTPATHGIIANDWYDRGLGRYVYCAEDTSVNSVGTDSDDGKMSPHRLLSTTITDELMLATNFKSKVVGISIKDRGSILPAGHTPTASYWFDGKSGNFITSTYYTNELPNWVKDFNNRKLAEEYLKGSWELSMPMEKYTASTADNMPYEHVIDTVKGAVFPYELSKLWNPERGYSLIKSTPYGNTILTELAKSTISSEEMGKDEITDFLAMSYSSSDYIGHAFGPRSIELEDMYIKLDQEIEGLLNFLDKNVGKGAYTVFLTADHAAAEVPQYLMDKDIPAGYFDNRALRSKVEEVLTKRFGKGEWIESFSNGQFFINHQTVLDRKVALEEVIEATIQEVLQFKGVAEAYSALEIRENEFTQGMKMRLQNGYNFQRSGDILLTLEPGWFGKGGSATTHGSGYTYDTHVPLLWYGAGISSGESFERQNITDIAPTLSFMLDVKLPNGAIGEPIKEVLGVHDN